MCEIFRGYGQQVSTVPAAGAPGRDTILKTEAATAEEGSMKRIGYIDYYLDEWHALNYPRWIREESGGAWGVTAAWADIEGSGFGRRTNQETADELGIELVTDLEQLIAGSDALIVLSPDDPAEHERLARAALCSGKPVYVDKTFAPDRASAIRMFDLAAAHGTPMYSTSALRYSSAWQPFAPGDITGLLSRGGGLLENYIIHQLEPISLFMGHDAKRVLASGSPGCELFVVEYAGGRSVSICQQPGLGFAITALLRDGQAVEMRAEDAFFPPMIAAMLRFFDSGEVPVPPADTIALMSLREALLAAARDRGHWVTVES
ncbi:MAG: Gfo/Idh/MocA family oxidoreductase [Bacillota bacterium]|nr:Gfo/Idh/MocA family oxidoreductase [Bacillota bacterium]